MKRFILLVGLVVNMNSLGNFTHVCIHDLIAADLIEERRRPSPVPRSEENTTTPEENISMVLPVGTGTFDPFSYYSGTTT